VQGCFSCPRTVGELLGVRSEQLDGLGLLVFVPFLDGLAEIQPRGLFPAFVLQLMRRVQDLAELACGRMNAETGLRRTNALRFVARSECAADSAARDSNRKSCRKAIILCTCLLFARRSQGAAQDSRPDEGNQHGNGGTKPLDLSRAPTTEEESDE
jgi:hypothetical protein